MEEVKKSYKPQRQLLLAVMSGILIGLLLFFAARVIFAKSPYPHYHANFAVFIDGQRDPFESFAFYEEVQSCSADTINNPRQRVHMHNQESDTVHIHDHGVTWGNFFENLGYGLADNALSTNKATYPDGQDGKELTFLLNGEAVESIAGRLIKSEDTLLVSYGNPENAKQQYDQISRSAGEHNHKPDPAACSGSNGLKFKDRLKQALNFTT